MIPLVLVHGFMGGSDQWVLQSPLNSERKLICIDLPGFGKNAGEEPIASINGYAEWVLSELTDLGVHRFDLLGHSMGGMIVQEMIHAAPERVRKLILYGTGAVGVLPGRFETIDTSMARAKADGPVATARRISATWFLHEASAEHFATCAAIAEKSALTAILSGLRAMQGWAGEAHLAAIGSDTLVLWGDKDRTYPWSQTELLWHTIPNAQLAVVPGCAHAVHMEKHNVFNLLVGEFLKGNSSSC